LLTAGQTAGGIKEILSVAEIMRRLAAEAEGALAAGAGLCTKGQTDSHYRRRLSESVGAG
jgi:hypothetical protein